MTSNTVLREKGQVTIPATIRRAAGLNEGDPMAVEVTDDGSILLRPQKVIDAAQAWFWTPEWQDGEREASADIAAGQLAYFDNEDDLLKELGG